MAKPSPRAGVSSSLSKRGAMTKTRKISSKHIMVGFFIMAALIISLQITFMHRVMSNQSSQEWQLNSNTPASVEHERKMAASQVFANPHHNSEMTVDEQMGINRTMLQEIQADPIPDVRDEATNQLLFNPEEFRTGDRTKYVPNRGDRCAPIGNRNQSCGS